MVYAHDKPYNKRMNKIKNHGLKTVVVLLISGLLVGSFVLAARQYSKNQTNKASVAKASEEQKASQLAQVQAEQANLKQKYDALRVECERGHDFYAKLPIYIQRTVTPPNCGPAVLL